MSRSSNQRQRDRIAWDLDYVERFRAEGKIDSARRILKSVESSLKTGPYNGGEPWRLLADRYLRVKASIDDPCACWFCCCDSEQKQKIREATASKEEDFASAYTKQESNFTGAHAEMVFGVRYGLTLNLTRGPDGGKDFEVPCAATPSGIVTIDIKGTIHCEIRDGIHRGRFPYQPAWNESNDHIYVLLHVAGREHVYFIGFSFGSDPYRSQSFSVNGGQVLGKEPKSLRSIEEFEQLIQRQ